MAGPQTPHVGSEFYSAFTDTVALARQAFRNERGTQFVITGTGTIAMEASVASLVERGDRTLTLSTGFFGRRMLMLNQIHGAKADILEPSEGEGVDPDSLRKALKKADYSVVFMTHVDTATSVANPVKELVEECARQGALSVVDGVCSVGGVPLEFDMWGVDVAFTASQKALASVPGAMLLAASQRALERMESRKEPVESFYMNLLRWKPIMEDPKSYLSTPATQVLLALHEALAEVKEEGMEGRWARHSELGRMMRSRVHEWGLELLTREGWSADTVTSFSVRKGQAGDIQRRLESDHGIVVARGLLEAKDSVIRVGHFGTLTPDRLGEALDDFGETLESLSRSPQPLGTVN